MATEHTTVRAKIHTRAKTARKVSIFLNKIFIQEFTVFSEDL